MCIFFKSSVRERSARGQTCGGCSGAHGQMRPFSAAGGRACVFLRGSGRRAKKFRGTRRDAFKNRKKYGTIDFSIRTLFAARTSGRGGGMSAKSMKNMMGMLGAMPLEQIIKLAGKRIPAGAMAYLNGQLTKIKKD